MRCKKIANIQSVKNEYSHMELKLSQMTSLAKMADDEEEPGDLRRLSLYLQVLCLWLSVFWQRLPRYSVE
ncbi:MAG: hypothetical protein ACLRI8_04605 [Agathobacter rectalis]